MPLMGHLIELRGRILKASVATVLGFFVAWAFHVELYDVLIAPIRDAMADNGLFSIKALQITESISVYVKLSLFGGFLVASPFVFYQVWAFVAPGLEDSERSTVLPIIAASVVFFVAGVAFCYFVVLPFMTDFLIKMTLEGQGLTLEPTLQSTATYALWLMLAFGLVFELPVFMYFLSSMGLVTTKGLLGFYRYWVVIAAIIGAVLTPTPDPINQALMTGPLVVLYGLGIGISWLVERDRSTRSGLPLRAVAVLVLLLTGVVLAGAAQILGNERRAPLQDIPADVPQLVGAHLPALPELRQRVQSLPASHALGPTALLQALELDKQLAPTLWLARFADGVAMVVQLEGATGVPRRVAKEREVSLVRYAGGPSALFALPGTEERWRVAAPDDGTLWIGHDAALAHLAAVRRGERPALGDDPQLVETVTSLRASGPIWSISLASAGIAAWLPGGALADTVTFASATIDARAARVALTLHCRGPEAARALRTRIEGWVADVRGQDKSAQVRAEGAAVARLSGQLEELARLLARATEATAAAGPQGGEDHVRLLEVSAEANRLAQDMANLGRRQQAQPTEAPPPEAVSTSVLAALVARPAVSTLGVDDGTVHWSVEATPDLVVQALFAPSTKGLDPAALRSAIDDQRAPAPVEPVRDGPHQAREGSGRRPDVR